MGDPAKVYERIEEMEQAQARRTPKAKAERARQELEKPSKEKPGEQK